MIGDLRITRLAETPGFMEAYEYELQRGVHKTYTEAYLECENLRIKYFGTPKFSSFDSFRTVRAKYLKKKDSKSPRKP
jgi:hypothetical protein